MGEGEKVQEKYIAQYVQHYIEKDNTKSAIMLNGEWGTGKSYFVENTLIPKITEKDHRCIVVSLYGLSTLSEVSQNVFLQLCLCGNNGKHEKWKKAAIQGGNFVLQTLVKSGANHFGIDLGNIDQVYETISSSVSLKNRLLIFEDVERTKIDIVEFMGYVNNLVEHDNAKILIVANEKEFIKEKKIISEEEFSSNTKQYTEETEHYLRIKEKTISDTINFEGEYSSAIQNIYQTFLPSSLNLIDEHIFTKETIHIFESFNCFNLRTLIFACQKAVDVYEQFKGEINKNLDLIKTIFFGMLQISIRIKKGEKILWKGNGYVSPELGNNQYPLLYFCYMYIINQHIDVDSFKKTKKEYEEYQMYNDAKSNNDADLKVLYNYYIYPEETLLQAVQNITEHLKDPKFFSLNSYGKIAEYLVIVQYYIKCDIEKAKEYLIKNLHDKSSKIRPEYLFSPMNIEGTPHEIHEAIEDLKNKMIKSLETTETTLFNFDYNPKHILDFATEVYKHESAIKLDRAFALRLDVDKITEMLLQSNAKEMNAFREVFASLYRPSNIGEFFYNDKSNLENLLKKLQDLNTYEKYDSVQKLQISWFIDNLNEILAKL